MSMIINSDKFHKIIIKMLKGENGKDGVSGDYAGLTNKPSINGIQLDGNITGNDLGLVSKQDIAQAIYPSGSIYLSTVNVNPASLFGGTWRRIKDVFLLASGDVYRAGDTGGEASHTLTVNEIPSHSHEIPKGIFSPDGFSASSGSSALTPQGSYGPLEISSTGGGQAHNNMPPYLVVYAWQRIDGTITDYTDTIELTIGANTIVSRQITLTYDPVANSVLTINYTKAGASATATFTAGIASQVTIDTGVVIEYDGAKSFNITSEGTNPNAIVINNCTYVANTGGGGDVPVERTETIGITFTARVEKEENFVLADMPVTGSTLTLKFLSGGNQRGANYTCGTPNTATQGGFTIEYDGAKTFTFYSDGTNVSTYNIQEVTYTA